jgi:hypothetical protein
MSTTPDLVARVDALEKAVQSLLGAVKILETIQENGSRKPAKRKSAAGRNAASAKKAASKKRGAKKVTA